MSTPPRLTEKEIDEHAATFSAFESMIRHLDWWYDRSDDHKEWRKGKDAMENARGLREVCKQIDEKRTKELWDRYCPYGKVTQC